MEFPEGLKYTKEHEWVRMEGGECFVGITEFAQSELGDLVFVDLPKVGQEVSQGGNLCVVESTKAASDVYSPVSGKIIEVNTQLSGTPELVNQDPYKTGWLVKLSATNPDELQKLMDASQYREYLGDKA